MTHKIKVLIVDDSAIVRKTLEEKLSTYEDIEVVGTAPDPFVARDKIVRLNPDVITLDIEMPRMDGLTFLEKLMRYHPIPVIIVSSVTADDTMASIKALELGAFDVVNKPGGSLSIQEVMDDIVYKIRQSSKIKDKFLSKIQISPLPKERPFQEKTNISILSSFKTTDKLIAIGASTGGTVALEQIFKALPSNLPPIVVVEHMPPKFTKQFAERLNQLSGLNIQEAAGNELLTAGNVFIAQGGLHMGVSRKGAMIYTELIDSERIHFQKPAVDILFESIANNVGKNALGVLLTGMGKDGAKGLLSMKKSGSATVVQDEATSVVWGMPKAAIDLGAADEILSLEKIIDKIVEFSKK
ncbi:MAG TPA: chemotaxis response regulator protein-glutamate methylesterase [Spirochaetia bacterium]|nr:MAG: chemotaxis response regulator protein-glutamate methylesterase [Spirochaetes bacterium GWB1_36_13]HCL57556.1 chemotaxis response regulator protein-glutamate methylesterase [Spirochaetia bacterium]